MTSIGQSLVIFFLWKDIQYKTSLYCTFPNEMESGLVTFPRIEPKYNVCIFQVNKKCLFYENMCSTGCYARVVDSDQSRDFYSNLTTGLIKIKYKTTQIVSFAILPFSAQALAKLD
jgi:hypothetical protein